MLGMVALSIVSDVMSALSIPGGATLSELATKAMDKRRLDAAQVLIEQLRQGNLTFDEQDIDPFVIIALRFARAVDEGVGKENLKLLARVIVGLKKNKALQDNEFSRWAATLSDLTRDEIVALGKAYQLTKASNWNADGADQFWTPFRDAMADGGYSEEQFLAICASISRYGLLLPQSVWGGLIYHPSQWLVELGALAELEAI
jgi:hypothetical protein